MTPRFLLDTNILSEPLRLRPDDGVMSRLKLHERALCTAAPVWNELVFGCARLPDGSKKRALREYLNDVVRPAVPVLAYDVAAASWHAQERARLQSIGRTAPFVDGMIAAIARTHGLTLVTNNVSDVEGFDGLIVERWHGTSAPIATTTTTTTTTTTATAPAAKGSP